jgi:tetratricopeptide (TPR) repeat protein
MHHRAQEHLNKGEIESAQNIYKKILIKDHGDLIARRNLGATLVEQTRLEEAKSHYQIAVIYHPKNAEMHFSLGVIAHRENEVWQAMTHYLKAIELNSQHIAAFENLAHLQTIMGLYEEALTTYQHILNIEPDRASTLYSMSLIFLLLGNFNEGWEIYENRWRTPDFGIKEPHEIQHLWTDISEVAGKKVLLVHEQGFGDTIQFCRYALILANYNAAVTLVVQPELLGLIHTINRFNLHQEIKIITKEEITTIEKPDFYLPLMTSPLAVKNAINGIPEIGKYLWANEGKSKLWRERLPKNKQRNVGIVWSGNPLHKNDSRRSIPLCQFMNILNHEENYHVLNKAISESEKSQIAEIQNIHLWADYLHDFEDTAALIDNLDYVISVDTALVHLTGAMGVPTKLLLPYSPDFRWLLNRIDTPWYKNVEIYRQRKFNDWGF